MEVSGFDFFGIDYGDGQLEVFQADALQTAKNFAGDKKVNSVLYYGNILEPGIEREHVYEETLTKEQWDEVTGEWLDDRRKRTVEKYQEKYT